MSKWTLDRKDDRLYVEDAIKVTASQRLALMHGETVEIDGVDYTIDDGPFIMVLPEEDEVVERGGPGSGHHGHAGRPGEVGGSLPSGETSGDPLSKRGMSMLRAWEDGRIIKPGSDEDGALVLDDGTIIRPHDRGPTFVDFTPTQIVEALKSGPAVITHTHPGNDMPFSIGDVSESMWDGFLELRALTSKTLYRMRFNLDADFDRKSRLSDILRDRLTVMDERVSKRFVNYLAELGPYPDSNEAKAANDLAARQVYSELWTNLANRFPDVIEFYIEEPR